MPPVCSKTFYLCCGKISYMVCSEVKQMLGLFQNFIHKSPMEFLLQQNFIIANWFVSKLFTHALRSNFNVL